MVNAFALFGPLRHRLARHVSISVVVRTLDRLPRARGGMNAEGPRIVMTRGPVFRKAQGAVCPV